MLDDAKCYYDNLLVRIYTPEYEAMSFIFLPNLKKHAFTTLVKMNILDTQFFWRYTTMIPQA